MALITRQSEAEVHAANQALQAARKSAIESANVARTADGETPNEGTVLTPVRLTQAQYDAATAKSNDVLYVIVG